MKTLLRNKNQYKKHINIMESKFSGISAPFRHNYHELPRFPCIVVSFITSDGRDYIINHEFVTKKDF